MRLAKYIIIAVILPSVILNAQGPKSLYQFLANWPAGCDTTGKHWVVYNLNKPETHYVTETSISSATTTSVWMAQIGNFNGSVNPWLPGDTLVAFGSIDSAYIHDPGTYGGNIDHTGFYWLFSDTVNSATPEMWSPSDTVWVMPKIDITKTGPGGGANDTIWFEFPNPKETRRVDQTDYDVYGYWLFADTTGAGTPDAFGAGTVMDLGVIPVTGDYGDTTVTWMLESDGFEAWETWTVYFAYHIVARPDTTADNIGYTTYYLSQNSDPVTVYQNVVAVEEDNSIGVGINRIEVSPNPSSGDFNVKFSAIGIGYATLRLYDVMGRDIGVYWQGNVKNGLNIIDLHSHARGIYFLVFESGEFKAKQKVVID